MEKKITFICLYDHQSTGVRILCSVLRDIGWDYNIIFFKKHLEYNIEEWPTKNETRLLIEKIKKLKSDFVGIQVYSSFRNLSSKISSQISELGIPVLWGGPHPTVDPEDSIRIADLIFIGESENTIKEFAWKISNGESISSIEGTWYREDDRIYRNPYRKLERNIDSFPFPTFENENTFLIENDQLIEYKENYKNYVMMTSRGCPYSCTFCISAFLRKMCGNENFVRSRSVQNCVEELEQITSTYPVTYICFNDEIFGTNKKWIQEFVVEYKKRISLPFYCLLHPRTVKEELLTALKDAGLRQVGMGIQSGNEKMLFDIFGRRTTKQKILKACNIINKLGFIVLYDVILNNPFDTEKTLCETTRLLLDIPKPFLLATYPLTPFHNTALTYKMLEKGFIAKSDIEGSASKGVIVWRAVAHGPRKFDSYWNGLISLCGSTRFPNWIIRVLLALRFLKHFPQVIWWCVKVRNNLVNRFGEKRSPQEDYQRIYCSTPQLAALANQEFFNNPVRELDTEELLQHNNMVGILPERWIIKGSAASAYDYLARTKYQPQEKGKYLVAMGTVYSGGFTLGLLCKENWASQVNVEGKGDFRAIVQVPNDDSYAVVLANWLSGSSLRNHFTINKIGWMEVIKPNGMEIK